MTEKPIPANEVLAALRHDLKRELARPFEENQRYLFAKLEALHDQLRDLAARALPPDLPPAPPLIGNDERRTRTDAIAETYQVRHDAAGQDVPQLLDAQAWYFGELLTLQGEVSTALIMRFQAAIVTLQQNDVTLARRVDRLELWRATTDERVQALVDDTDAQARHNAAIEQRLTELELRLPLPTGDADA